MECMDMDMKPDGRGWREQADRQQLAELKQYQQSVRLGDDVATEMVKEAGRANIEADLDLAVECIKARTQKRDVSVAMTAVRRRSKQHSHSAQAVNSVGRACQYDALGVMGGAHRHQCSITISKQ